MRARNLFFFVFFCVVSAVPAYAVLIASVLLEPVNVTVPVVGGEQFSFDLATVNPIGLIATSFQSTLDVDTFGHLTFDGVSSEAVVPETGYWIYGNSAGVAAIKYNGTYEFSDYANTPSAEFVDDDDIMARYTFTWDGTAGDYVFILDLNIINSFFLREDFVTKEELRFSPIAYVFTSGESSFTIIPEPATLVLLSLGSLCLLRKWS